MRRHVKVWAVIGLLWLFLAVAMAYGQPCQGMSVALVPLGYESVTAGSAAVGLTASVYASTSGTASYALIDVESADIRYLVTGANPSSSNGHPVANGGELTLCGIDAIRQFKAIRSGGSDATLRVTYFRAR
jgi:hypothetical protein